MLTFKSFVEAINTAVQSANNTLTERHEELLRDYFEPAEKSVPNAKGGKVQDGPLRARSVCLEYPAQTAQGIEMVKIDVPLLTIVPLTFPQIESVKFSAQFKLGMLNDEMTIDFAKGPAKPKSKSKTLEDQPPEEESSSLGQIEITIVPSEGTEGVKRIIEGYEKALRAQMPH